MIVRDHKTIQTFWNSISFCQSSPSFVTPVITCYSTAMNPSPVPCKTRNKNLFNKALFPEMALVRQLCTRIGKFRIKIFFSKFSIFLYDDVVMNLKLDSEPIVSHRLRKQQECSYPKERDEVILKRNLFHFVSLFRQINHYKT